MTSPVMSHHGLNEECWSFGLVLEGLITRNRTATKSDDATFVESHLQTPRVPFSASKSRKILKQELRKEILFVRP
jgi:hypothetical protein